jgi:cytoskeletal protein CcmA (bactofilin family)
MRAIVTFAMLGFLASGTVSPSEDERSVALGNDLFRAGDRVVVTDAVTGDALLAGGAVEMRGSAGGDVAAAGGEVEIAGDVGEDLYAAGGRVTVRGKVGGSARLAGGEVEIEENASLEDGVTIGGGEVRVRGHVGRYLQVAGGEVRIDGRVDGDVNVSSGRLSVGPDAVISGRLTHRGPREPRVDSGAQIAGGVQHVAERRDGRVASGVLSAFSFVWWLGWTLIGVLLIALLPQATRAVTDHIRSRPGAAALFGLAVLVLVPVAILITFITVIGIPLAILLLLLYVLVLPLGYLASVVALVDALLPRVRKAAPPSTLMRVGAFVLIAIVVFLVTRIDFIGGLVGFALLIVGLGGLALVARRASKPATRAPAV